ncbi:MAG: chemotaxis protein CheY [Myxococcaceae bacterium]|nr:chemotaxis protein CheY [Myxococcaceae bacterium]
MVIDDEVDVRESLTEWLCNIGYEAFAASNGREALAQLRAKAHLPHAILLDMMMPIMDGLSFRWEQLADPKLASIPVIILSASGHCHQTAEELCTAGCIRKPCQPDELLETLARVCRSHAEPEVQ